MNSEFQTPTRRAEAQRRRESKFRGRCSGLAGGISRRAAIGLGAAGVVGLAGAVSFFDFFAKWRESEAPADIFKGDAPTGELWELWQKRGWVKEARHYLKLGRNVQCKVCPNNCILAPGDRSHCRNKVNRDGTLYTLVYGNPCTFHVDPVEKKPLFHFLPGTLSFSLATSGCVFRCLNCQNWEISQKKPEETKDPRGEELRLEPAVAAGPHAGTNVAAEPVPRRRRRRDRGAGLPVHFLHLLRADGVLRIHAGHLQGGARAEAQEHRRHLRLDRGAARARPVSIRGRRACGPERVRRGHLQETQLRQTPAILDTLKTLKELGVWFEIINLVVPTYTDNLDTIRRMCGWIVKELGPDQPLHFSRFHPQHKLAHLTPTPVETLVKARDAARAEGLRYVYIGNVPGLEGAETTWCPNCKKAVVERDIFAVTRMDIADGKCRFCGTKIAGVWA